MICESALFSNFNNSSNILNGDKNINSVDVRSCNKPTTRL